MMSIAYQPGQAVSPAGGASGHQSANLGDILERVLDRGLVIVGDIRVSLLDIELLTIKLRLLIASVDTARQLGIDWWEHDPWLSSGQRTPVDSGRKPPPVEAEQHRAPVEAEQHRAPVEDDRHREVTS